MTHEVVENTDELSFGEAQLGGSNPAWLLGNG
jgi:hypothetical protein